MFDHFAEKAIDKDINLNTGENPESGQEKSTVSEAYIWPGCRLPVRRDQVEIPHLEITHNDNIESKTGLVKIIFGLREGKLDRNSRVSEDLAELFSRASAVGGLEVENLQNRINAGLAGTGRSIEVQIDGKRIPPGAYFIRLMDRDGQQLGDTVRAVGRGPK
ncbi:MAG: hypothetical protein KC777_21285 [Cyanobacteria bacterium HKST-UBA02]|nr:hypothetical protein [Cyanobacteria bacterium HKST-UBA02]